MPTRLGDRWHGFADGAGAVADRADRISWTHDRFSAFLEAHIEQGPMLDAPGEAVGVVTGIVGLRQFSVTITGQQNHAGTTPMAQRTDAFAAAARVSAMLPERFANIVTPQSVWTIGHIRLHPNASSIVPGRAEFTLQWRDIDADGWTGWRPRSTRFWMRSRPPADARRGGAPAPGPHPVPMDAAAARAGRSGGGVAPGRWRSMPSGALHDASNLSRVMPVAMLFVPSIGGISHDFAEDTAEDDLATGVRVLCDAVAGCARVSPGAVRVPAMCLAEGDAAFPKLAHPPDQRDGPVDRSFDIHAAITDVGQAIARAVRHAHAGVVRDVDAKAVGGGKARTFAERDDHRLRTERHGDRVAEGHTGLMGDYDRVRGTIPLPRQTRASATMKAGPARDWRRDRRNRRPGRSPRRPSRTRREYLPVHSAGSGPGPVSE
jgi:hypothetical protein